MNYGICQDDGVCNCLPPYSGPDCSVVPPCLDDSDCNEYNTYGGIGGYCDITTGRCVCDEGEIAGPMCEVYGSCDYDEHCMDKGTCNLASGTCECAPGSGGVNCENFLAGAYDSWKDKVQQNFENHVLECDFNLTCLEFQEYAIDVYDEYEYNV